MYHLINNYINLGKTKLVGYHRSDDMNIKKIKRSLTLLAASIFLCTLVSCELKMKNEPVNKDDAVFTMAELQGNKWGAEAAKRDNNLTEESMLKYALQDEYTLRSRYEFIIKKFEDKKHFSDMVRDENINISILMSMLTKYSIPIPADMAEDYIITFPKNISDAYALSIKAENENIEMYERFLDNSNLKEETKALFKNLINCSREHLEILKKGGE